MPFQVVSGDFSIARAPAVRRSLIIGQKSSTGMAAYALKEAMELVNVIEGQNTRVVPASERKVTPTPAEMLA